MGKVFNCILCDISFEFKSKLKHHERKEHNKNRSVCMECGKDFICKESLKVHMNLHTDEKKYKCREDCDKAFRIPQHRIVHEKAHRGVKDYKYPCPKCEEGFQCHSKLDSHMMLHTGEKGYCCREGCSKTFGGRSSRVYHETSSGKARGRCYTVYCLLLTVNVGC